MRHVLPYIMRGQASESGTGTLQFAAGTVSKSARSMEIVTVVSAFSVQEDCGKLRRRTTSTRSSTATILLVLMLTLGLAAALVGASGPAQTCAHAALARRECLG